ncbi:transposase, partial [Chelatococcus sp.]|uniref:transposase n=1 Tax=Chelatococcus sp. TaxID=1953771 RepID=UPI0025B8F513
MNRDCFWLTDEQFARIAPHLPNDTRGKPRVDDWRVISGIVHVLSKGCHALRSPRDQFAFRSLHRRDHQLLVMSLG